MNGNFILIGLDDKGVLSGPIAKKQFDNYDDAVEHSRTVLSSGGNPNLVNIFIMETVAVARRVSPPVEVTPVVRYITKAA